MHEMKLGNGIIICIMSICVRIKSKERTPWKKVALEAIRMKFMKKDKTSS
jgi:hypothetical protein